MNVLSGIWPVRLHRSITSLLLLCVCSAGSAVSVADAIPKLSTTLSAVTPVEAPDFTLFDMDETAHSLSGLRGNVVLVNFWATWCPPCRKEMPSLESVYQQYKDRGLRVVAVNQWESPDHVFSYMGELEVFPTFPILFDRKSEISEHYGVRGLPTSFIVDREGRIIYKAIGGREFDHPDMTKLIESLLE